MSNGLAVSMSQNIGNAHNARVPALRSARLRRPSRSETAAKNITPAPITTITQ